MTRYSMLQKDNIMISCNRHRQTEPHDHEFMELVYVLDGRAVHMAGGIRKEVKKGDYFIIDYGITHQYVEGNGVFEVMNCLFTPELIDKALAGCRDFREMITHYLIKFSYRNPETISATTIFQDDDGQIYQLMQKMRTEHETQRPGYVELMRCFLIEVIISMMRKLGEGSSRAAEDSCCQYVLDYIDENYMQSITLSDLGRRLHFSLPYLSKKIKDQMGESFSSMLQKKRIQNSCHLLANTENSVEEIAELVGYKDVKFFRGMFRKQLQMTPREFRRLHR